MTIDSKLIKYDASCSTFGDWAIRNGLKVSNPKRGDIVLFDFNHNGTSDHGGLVLSADGNTIYTVEGNTSITSNDNGGCVMKRSRTNPQINYFVRPKYTDEVTAEMVVQTALDEVGTKEKPAGSNKCKYNTWYYGREVSGSAYPWCMVFVSWVYAHVKGEAKPSDKSTYSGDFPTIPTCKIGEAAYNADKKSGDSKGSEVRVKKWYNFGQTHCFRFKDSEKGISASVLIADACANNKVGYDNTSKAKSLSFRKEAQKHNWNAKAIDKKCDTACSQFCLAGVMSTGIAVNDYRNSAGLITELKKFPSDFSDLTATKYLTKCDSLYEGDILVKAKKHALMVVQGEHLRFGNTGTNVKKLQKFLNWAGFDCGTVDGDFGANTKLAVMLFQKEVGLSQTGYFGSKALKKAKEYKR